jgi:hypothetical protein
MKRSPANTIGETVVEDEEKMNLADNNHVLER